MTSAYIFSGPTLPPFQALETLERMPQGHKIKLLPPCAEGDILQLIPLKPAVIGIIDGYFETVPAVWHKEILYAMSRGIHVLGSSSMGALRAAELEAFGMEGVGAIFQAFSDGFLEDDDEVTVVHGDETLGFPPLSEAMVNIRRTLDDARAEKILSRSEREALLSIAKQLHYKSRNYGKILARAQEEGLPPQILEGFRSWLPQGRKDQKMLDALALLDNIAGKLEGPLMPKTVLYRFESTIPWQSARTKTAKTV